jgi:transglutaminase-like putative cysteine protease
MPVYAVEHTTTYRYRRPVGFGEHRLMGRPRDAADQRLIDWSVEISPDPDRVTSVQDAFGNLVTLISISARARELRVVNRLRIDHHPSDPDAGSLADYAATWPFAYDADDTADLARAREPHAPDPGHVVGRWARRFLNGTATPTLDMLRAMTNAIRDDFTYRARFEEGVQDPARTLALRTGTCRDYAVLMMEAVRSLGLAARFVTGYLHTPSVGPQRVGAGATHAWLEVFLPGLGWVDFDPTNAIVGSRDLIRVACVRDWRQAVPLAGTWTGFPSDSLGMDVSVRVEDMTPGMTPASQSTVVPFAERQACAG